MVYGKDVHSMGTSMRRLSLLTCLMAVGLAAPALAEPPNITGLSSSDALNSLGGPTGTTSYNSSAGQSNSFAVGASNTLGVNASASSTADYGVSSRAALMSQGSYLNQSLGNSGSSINSASSSQKMEYDQAASNSASVAVGSSWEAACKSSCQWASQSDWQAAWDSAYSQSYQAASSSDNLKAVAAANGTITGTFDSSSNSAKLEGLGSNASINTGYGSSFIVDVKAKPDAESASNSATANGSAGANLSTNATVNSSQVQFTSTFVQSF